MCLKMPQPPSSVQTREELLRSQIEDEFRSLCKQVGRQGIIGFSALEDTKLMPVQSEYLARKLNGLGPRSKIAVISIGLLYKEQELLAIPTGWVGRSPEDGSWNRYARAYTELNHTLNRMSSQMGEKFGGVAEQATKEGLAIEASHVSEYFPVTVSHRAFAETAKLGWRGRHSLIVTPEAGPALRFATVFVPETLGRVDRDLSGCGRCEACLQVCPILREAGSHNKDYRETCRLRIKALGLEDEVCGICVRTCWEAVRTSKNREPA
jgi:epoxyqueuosine reductase QueG